MKVTEITVGYTRKLNLGNYESADVSVSLTASLDEGEEQSRAVQALMTEARVQVAHVCSTLKPKDGAK